MSRGCLLNGAARSPRCLYTPNDSSRPLPAASSTHLRLSGQRHSRRLRLSPNLLLPRPCKRFVCQETAHSVFLPSSVSLSLLPRTAPSGRLYVVYLCEDIIGRLPLSLVAFVSFLLHCYLSPLLLFLLLLLHQVLEQQLLQLPSPECLDTNERRETQMNVGHALLHVSRCCLSCLL